MSETGTYHVIKSQKVAGHAMEQGYRLLKMEPAKDNPKFNVFYFVKSDALSECIEKYRNKNN